MRALTFLLSAAVATLVLAAPVAADRRVCLTFGNIYYDIKTGASGTTLERWSNGNLLDSNWYAQLAQPPSGTMWGDGVAYAATMQTRHVWVNTELNSPASWEVVSGEDIWRFDTTISGSPTQLVFRSSNCITMTPPSPSPAPPTPNPNALRRVCGTVGDTYYDMWTSPAGTIMLRFSQGRWLQTQDFAPLHMAAAGQMWSEGVVFAATMQTRHSWFNTEPNPTARWEVVNGEDFWSFDTVMNGNPQTITFRTSNCMGDATPVPPTAEPVRRVCMIDYGASKYYEARTSSAGTYWDRRDYPSGNLIDSNWFAKLNEPVPQEAMWGEGVAFAATMQTRHVWINTEPNTEAYWLRDSQQDRWTFKTTFEGLGVEYQLIENACVNDWNSVPKPV